MVKLYEIFFTGIQVKIFKVKMKTLTYPENSHKFILICSHAQSIFYKGKHAKRKDINFGLNSILIRDEKVKQTFLLL